MRDRETNREEHCCRCRSEDGRADAGKAEEIVWNETAETPCDVKKQAPNCLRIEVHNGKQHGAGIAPAHAPQAQGPDGQGQPQIAESAMVRDSHLGRWTEVADRAQLVECRIGDYSYVMNDSDLMYTTVGKFCSIASHVRINPSNHPMWRATQHHFTYRASFYGFGEDEPWLFDWRKQSPVTLGHDVWVGHGAIILPGNTIGTGAVVAAGAVVTKDVPDYTIVAGVPAKPIRQRFPQDIQQALKRIAWWDWDHERIGAALNDFRAADVREFVRRYGE
ncbi:MAG: chloramphenicol acetyltransferase [Halodesulfovibrio sp.]